MRPTDLQYRALQVLEIVDAHKPFEDSLIELKAKWPSVEDDEKAYRTVRQLAGHLNAARGDSVIWLIGVDEKAGVCGAETKDLANEWWPALRGYFDGSEPGLLQSVINHAGKTVTAIRFDGSLPPFVVRVLGRPREHDVPWRDGTETRSARRNELLRILVPESRAPVGEVTAVSSGAEMLACTLLVAPRTPGPVLFVSRRSKFMFEGIQGEVACSDLSDDRSKPTELEKWVHRTPHGIMMEQSGTLIVRCFLPAGLRGDHIRVTLTVGRADPDDKPLVVSFTLVGRGSEWGLHRSPQV